MNGCTGKMGRAVLEAAISAGLQPVPVAFSGPEDSGKTVDVGGKQITVHGPSDRESTLFSIFEQHPDLIVVDYTVPAAVNGKLSKLINMVFCKSYRNLDKRMGVLVLVLYHGIHVTCVRCIYLTSYL